MKPVIETHALCKSYHGRPVVDHLNLTVPEGCVYGFLGPNGAGKSTTMKMLLGLVHPTGGSVELLGHTLNEANRIALLRQTGSLIESPSGYLHLTARENLSIVADLKDVDRKDISRVLEIVHLTKDADRKVGQYSLGMKQRLGIAMALLGSPKLLILDEPTNGLDPAGIQEMRSLIASMPQTTGATVLISSHLLGEIEQMVDQVGILNHGKLLFEGSLQQLQKHSRGGILLRVLDAPKATAVLQQQGVKAAAPADQPDTLQLPPLPDEALAALVCTLAESGVGVVGLTAQTKSLEDIFLSLTLAAHECGHAVQHARMYAPLKMRSALVPVVNFASSIMTWVLLGGILLIESFPQLLLAGIILFAMTTLFSFITLPVEINASKRALVWLSSSGITNSYNHAQAEDALRSAAYTCVVAALGSLATLVYYIMIFMGRRD